jgi:hypothetical protein
VPQGCCPLYSIPKSRGRLKQLSTAQPPQRPPGRVAEGGSGDGARIRYELPSAPDDGSAAALPYSRIIPELEPGSLMTGEPSSVNQETVELDRFGGPRALIRGSGKAKGAIRRDAARGLRWEADRCELSS